MTADKLRIDRLTFELQEAIIDNGGVECEQVPTVFFPEEWTIPVGRGGNANGEGSGNMYQMAITTARQICFRCPVIDKCLKVGMFEDYGIWGGTTPKQRRKIKKDRTD
jgi:hypothetical protein